MPKLTANLSMMFQEYPFLKRFAAARKCGFKGVEFHFPYEWSKGALAEVLAENEMEQVLFNMPPGDWDNGEKGIAALPGRETEFAEGVEQALEYAKAMGCTRLHAMAGIVEDGNDIRKNEEIFVENLRHAADQCAKEKVRLLIEPLNTIDTPGYFLSTSKQAMKIIERVGSDNLFLQFDIYHAQIMEGNLAGLLTGLLPDIEHIQIASVPGRNEPVDGEINYPWLFSHFDEIGYQGWVGCEYFPKGNTQKGLAWATSYFD